MFASAFVFIILVLKLLTTDDLNFICNRSFVKRKVLELPSILRIAFGLLAWCLSKYIFCCLEGGGGSPRWPRALCRRCNAARPGEATQKIAQEESAVERNI